MTISLHRSWRGFYAILGNELSVLRSDLTPIVLIVGMPLVVAPLVNRAMSAALLLEGFGPDMGAKQTVPGMAVTFGFFSASTVGLSVFREHNWRTWVRLRASGVPTSQILTAKALPWVVVSILQTYVLFVVGVAFLGLEADGLVTHVFMIAAAYGAAIASLGLAVTAFVRTSQRLSSGLSLGTLVSGSLGGALLPMSLLPAWASAVAMITPSYWAMQAYRGWLLERSSWSVTLVPVVVMVGFALVCSGLAAARMGHFDTIQIDG